MSRPPFQSSMNHVALQAPGSDLWVVGYQVPGTTVVSVLGEGYSEGAAKAQARQLNFPRSTPVRRDWKPESAVYSPVGAWGRG